MYMQFFIYFLNRTLYMYIAGQYIGTLLSPKTKMHVYNKETYL